MMLLENAVHATLYNMDCSFLSSVRFIRFSLESARFYFSDIPEGGLPAQFFVMPDDKQYDYRAFIYKLQGKPQPCAEDNTCWQADGITDDIPELQSNFRVYVSFRTSIWLDKETREHSLTIKDIGTGGFRRRRYSVRAFARCQRSCICQSQDTKAPPRAQRRNLRLWLPVPGSYRQGRGQDSEIRLSDGSAPGQSKRAENINTQESIPFTREYSPGFLPAHLGRTPHSSARLLPPSCPLRPLHAYGAYISGSMRRYPL